MKQSNIFRYSEIVKEFTVEYTAGGAAQNSLRAASVSVMMFISQHLFKKVK